ncbi:hypothetical protein [Mesorhizobium ciceri]|uniref:hypothetical protein n=1 Tax=Mesorhizobium ciceri TaxID=39645 RepID=UPI003B847968
MRLGWWNGPSCAVLTGARKPSEGMMLHQDGSRHQWLAGGPMLDLIVTMDDATSTIYSAFLIEEEGTSSSFQGLLETFVAKGLPGRRCCRQDSLDPGWPGARSARHRTYSSPFA